MILSVVYLGHRIGTGLHPVSENVEALQDANDLS